MENKQILENVKKLYVLYHEGKIPTLTQHEVNPGLPKSSRENYLYFTLAPCINFQRSSPAMWASALKTWQDPETNYLFFPEHVVQCKREKVQKDLLKYKLALQLNKHTDIWITISKAFNKNFGNDPRELFKQNSWDIIKILNVIQIEKRKDFPYLSGPKLSNYWLYILAHYTDATFINMHELSIIPDTHVLQSTVKLGLAETIPEPLVAAKLWKDLLTKSELTPVQMHAVLWNWSRNNFKPEL